MPVLRLHSKTANQGCGFTLRDNRLSRRKYSHPPELTGMQGRGAKAAGGGGGWNRHTPKVDEVTHNSPEGKNANQARCTHPTGSAQLPASGKASSCSHSPAGPDTVPGASPCLAFQCLRVPWLKTHRFWLELCFDIPDSKC